MLLTAHVSGPDFAFIDNAEGSTSNAVGKMVQTVKKVVRNVPRRIKSI